MSKPSPVIDVQSVGKKFCRNLKRSLWYGVQDSISEFLPARSNGAHLRKDEFWANQDISFSLYPGECLGLIGHNGAGKTTLLKMLNGLIKPDQGEIQIRGTIGALIALGAGFNPILSGRENIYVNSAILGRSQKETRQAFDEIVDFSEINEFIDAPVMTYSSGMQVRLGFAIASQFRPEIMLVDEVLAVGDNKFQSKCFERIFEMRQKGTSFIVVSHNPYQLETLCEKVAVLDHGKLATVDSPRQALLKYHALATHDITNAISPPVKHEHDHREGTGAIRILDVSTFDAEENATNEFETGSPILFRFEIIVRETISGVRFRFHIASQSDQLISNIASSSKSEEIVFEPGKYTVEFLVDHCDLVSGLFTINAVVVDVRSIRLDVFRRCSQIAVKTTSQNAINETGGHGMLRMRGNWNFKKN